MRHPHTLGEEVGRYTLYEMEFLKLQFERLLAGLVGQWWLVIHERCQVS
jgi:hypothetical protein